MNQSIEENKIVKKSNATFIVLIIFVILLIIGVGIYLSFKSNQNSKDLENTQNVTNGANKVPVKNNESFVEFITSENSTKDAIVKTDITQMRTLAVLYYDENDTYKGLENDPNIKLLVEDAKEKGFEVEFQILFDESYVIYTMLKSENNYWCADASDFNGKVSRILPTQNTCLN